MGFVKVFFIFFLLQLLQKPLVQAIDFDVTKYGAIPGGTTDSTKVYILRPIVCLYLCLKIFLHTKIAFNLQQKRNLFFMLKYKEVTFFL